jgi:AcrR family transcriptional regulator
MDPMSLDERRLRADAERNRRRLLDAAQELFRERGLDVGVAEIAQRAGVGRGTLFRNFATKEALIVAIVSERMREMAERGRGLLDQPDAARALVSFLEEMAGAQQLDRALSEAVADELLVNPEIRSAHGEFVSTVDALLERAQAEGAVRSDVGALDVLMLVKGACQAASAFSHIDPDLARRQLDHALGSLRAPPAEQPLRGRIPTLEDLDRAFPLAPPAPAASDPPAGA